MTIATLLITLVTKSHESPSKLWFSAPVLTVELECDLIDASAAQPYWRSNLQLLRVRSGS